MARRSGAAGNLRHAALFVCGDVPTGAGLTTGDVANPNCEYDFQNATVPVFYGMQKGASHLSTYDGIGDDTQRTQFARAIIGWLGWKLAGEQPLATMFVGASCTLCTDPAWTIEQRGLCPSLVAWPATVAALLRPRRTPTSKHLPNPRSSLALPIIVGTTNEQLLGGDR
jgi:hypothetical protein